ncbi:methyltransferase domain-containing protein [Arthrobacter sp. G.S.26]|uniref:methyltransferase domain-containing protein n=1 Tax=Arthrobacter sp. G.S.26 TaxID=3433706 RepID=UPI003D77FE00
MPFAPHLSLLCPVCRQPFEPSGAHPQAGKRLVCPAGHSFDAARQGYFNFLVGKGTAFEADSAAMVEARHSFLAAGHYLPLATAVAAAVVRVLPATGAAVLDSGTGTGQYLRVLLDQAAATAPAAYGLDISKYALRRAARLNPEAMNLVWDIWQPLPLATDSVDAVTVVFAPRNPAEFARVLRPAGRLVVVTPRSGHLAELAARTGMLAIEEGKDARLAAAMASHFDLESSSDIDIPLSLTVSQATDLAFMGPAGHHLGREAIAGRLAGSREPVTAEARFKLLVFTPAQTPAE